MTQEESLQLIEQAAKDSRESLYLSEKGLTELPTEIPTMTVIITK